VFGVLASRTLRSAATRRLAVSLFSILAIGVLASLPAATPAQVHLATTPAASGSWLVRLNQWRTSTGLSSLTENTVWSQGDAAHAYYMVKTGQATHSEDPSNPYYTVAGDTAARNSNIQVSSTTSTTDDQAIDWWMAAPFHAMGMMDPRLSQTGFGSYRDGATSPWQEGGALDTIHGNSFSGGSYPVYFPGNGTVEPLTTYSGNEFPNPLQACPGYSSPAGLPVFIQVGGNVNTTAGPVHSFTGNGIALNHCVIDSSNSAVSSYLYTRGGVIVVPQQPLQNGVKYVVALTVNGVPYTWTFTVGAFIASVTGISPNAGPAAGGTGLTISGAGFSSGVTSVKFGTTPATSFSVVNDTTITAVSPAHAAGTVDVSVTTANGTSASSTLDHFTFGACMSVIESAAPPSTAPAGTSVNFTASASGCATNPLYQFWLLAPGSTNWTIARAYSSTATFSWSTAGLATGSYRYTVWARDASSTGASCNNLGCFDGYSPSTAYTLTLTSTVCSSVAESVAPPSTATTGTSVTFTAGSSGCPNPVYQFWLLAPGSNTWTIGQSYSSTAAFAWNTTGLAPGTYTHTVWVRDASNSGIACNNLGCFDAYVPATAYALTLPATVCTAASESATPPSIATAGTTVTFNANASGCPNPRYQFWLLAPGSTTWTIGQPYSGTSTFTWNTTGLPSGGYGYTVWARDAGSAGGACNNLGCFDAYAPATTYTVTSTPACTSVSETAAPASTASAGTSVTFTAVASGCPNPRYQFWTLAPGSTTWMIAQSYSSTASFSWNTTGLAAGSYTYTVWVRDAGGSGTACNNLGCFDAYFPATNYTLTPPSTACSSVTESVAPPSTASTGTAVKFTASASGCANPRYQFWLLAPGSTTWTIAQPYSGTSTFTWNTTGLSPGTYRYTVWVRDASSAGTACNNLGCFDAYFTATNYTLT
jgi:uncharacterized protein YkwD